MELSNETKRAIGIQAGGAVSGALIGAITKRAITPRPGMHGQTAAQIASATAAAAASGAGFSGSVAAGTAVVTAKVVAGVAAATAAAPFVLGAAVVGAAGYGLYRVFKS